MRALIGAFAMANQTQFNRADGAGYDFLADTVLALDPQNPQVAARLLSALKSWRALEPERRALRRGGAARASPTAPALSRDVARHRAALAGRRLKLAIGVSSSAVTRPG